MQRGLDLLNPDETTEEEKADFRADYLREDGRVHRGFDFLLANEPGPAILKRYQLAVRMQGFREGLGHPGGFRHPRTIVPLTIAYIGYYATLGFDEGIRYSVRPLQNAGFSRHQVIEAVAIPFLRVGPRGIEAIAAALEGFEWKEVEQGIEWDGGWGVDPEAFSSGIDFSTTEVLPAELEKIQQWYLRNLGELPPYVRYLARHHPPLLKAYRNRFEHLVVTLPKQLVPTSLLLLNLLLGERESVREYLLLCRAFGVSRRDMWTVLHGSFTYGLEKATMAYEVAADVLDSWS